MTDHHPNGDVALDQVVDRTVREMTAAPPCDDLTRRVLDHLRTETRPRRWPSWAMVTAVATGLVAVAWLAFEVAAPRDGAPVEPTSVVTTAPPATPQSAEADDDAPVEAPETDPTATTRRPVRPRRPAARAPIVDLTSVDFRVEFAPPLDVGDIPVAEVLLAEIDMDGVAVERIETGPVDATSFHPGASR